MDSLPGAWAGEYRCTATNRAGERCGRRSIAGGTVCVMHGGSIPAVQQSAKLRLLAMVDPVMGAFEEILDSWHRTKCETCGKPTGDPAPVIRVGQLVLDRSGFHPTLTVEQAAPPNPYADFSEDELIEKLEAMLADARARRDMHRAHALPDAVDAVLLDAVLLDDAFIVPEDAPLEASASEDVWSSPPEGMPKEPASD